MTATKTMKDETATVKEMIQAAITRANGDRKACAKAMKSIRWRIRNIAGLYVGLDGIETELMPPGSAGIQTFDGRDNEDMKLAFFRKFHGSDLFIEIAE